MKKYILLIIVFLMNNTIFAHCQIPCGIYDDAIRILQIKEDFKTIEKAMVKIEELSKISDALSHNQLNRWIIEKENHASNIQKIVSDYFLTQRIKETNEKYYEQISILQRLLVLAMKCKQTLKKENVQKGLKLVTSFSEIYFDSHGLEHLKKITN